MITPERAVQTLAEWAHAYVAKDHADEPDVTPDISLVEFAEDYLNNYRVMTSSEINELLVIDMQLGSFDHGAGNGVLMYAWGDLVWLYEGEVLIIASQHGDDLAGFDLCYPANNDPTKER